MGKINTAESSAIKSGKVFGGRISNQLSTAIKVLGAKNNRTVQDILIEALQDVLKKHGEKVPKE